MSDEKFVVDSDSKADWVLQKIKELKEKKQEKEELAEERIYQIEQWLKEETNKLNNQIENFEAMLAEYADKLKEQDPDFKTKSLPFGKIQYRKQRAKWQYDNEKLTEYAEKNIPKAVKTKKKVDKRELKKLVEVAGDKVVHPETGEIVEGIKVQERGEKLYIKTE